jgi:excisionase family DNA binding protein
MSHLIEAFSEIEKSLPALLTASEAANLLRTSPRNLRRLIVAGRIASLRERETGSSRVLIPRAEIGRYLTSLVAL